MFKFDENDKHFEITDNKGNGGKKWLMLITNSELLNDVVNYLKDTPISSALNISSY